MESNSWRNQLSPTKRELILDRIMDKLCEHVPEQLLPQIKKLVMKFEEKIYSNATSKEDYLKRITIKVMALEGKSHKFVPSTLGSESPCTTDTFPDPASQKMNSRTNVQLSPVTVQTAKKSQAQQQQMVQNTPNVIASFGVQDSTSLRSVRPPIRGSTNTHKTSVSAESPIQQNISGILQSSVRNSMPQVASPNLYVGHHRQSPQNQPQHLTSLKNSGRQQSQPPILKQIKMETLSGSLQTHTEGEGQNQQDQMQLQPVRRQPQHVHSIHHNLLPLQQQSHLPGQQLSTVNGQQGQLINHQSNYAGMQQHGKEPVNGRGNSSMQQDTVALQGQTKHNNSASLQVQGQHSHPQPREKQLASYSKPVNSQQASNPSQQDMRHRLHASAGKDCCLFSKEHTSLEKDRKEEVLAKIEQLKNKYFSTLNALLQKLLTELKSYESLSPQPKHGRVETLKVTSMMLVNLCSYLKNPQERSDIFYHLDRFEQRIISIINGFKQNKSMPGQLPPTVLSMNQSPLPHGPPSHAHIQITQDDRKLLLHSTNSPSTARTVHQNNETSLHNDSVSSLSQTATAQQSDMHMQQHSAAPDSKVGILIKSSAQITVGCQQITSSARLQPDSELQVHPNMKSFMSNPNVLQNIHLIQQNVQTMKPRQEVDNHQMHRPLTQQRRQIVQYVILSKGVEENKSKIIEGSDVKQEALQQHQSAGQCSSYSHHRSIASTLLSASSPELLQAATPRANKSNLLGSLAISGAASSNRNSNFIPCSVPKSTSLSPLHRLRDSKNLNCDVSSFSICGNDKNQPGKGAVESPRGRVMSAAGVSTLPSHADSNNLDDTQSYPSTSISDKSSPLQRLVKVVNSMSSKALSAAVSEIGSIISVTDRMAEIPTAIRESECVMGKDMWIMTKSHLQARVFTDMDFSLGTRKMKRGTSQMPWDIVAYAGGVNCLDSTTPCAKRLRVNTNHFLLEEIRKVNQQLIDTVVDISDEDGNKTESGFDEGTIVTCSFRGVAVNPNILMPSIQPLRVFVPNSYPNCSPVLLDKLNPEMSEKEVIREKAKRRVEEAMAMGHNPITLEEIVRKWDQSAGEVILEMATQSGGGTFSSKYGTWNTKSYLNLTAV